MNENDPNFLKDVLVWVVNAVFAIALTLGARNYSRAMQKADKEKERTQVAIDDLEARTRALEKESVTHEDLRRIEDKMDDFTKQVTDRLDRILERQTRT